MRISTDRSRRLPMATARLRVGNATWAAMQAESARFGDGACAFCSLPVDLDETLRADEIVCVDRDGLVVTGATCP